MNYQNDKKKRKCSKWMRKNLEPNNLIERGLTKVKTFSKIDIQGINPLTSPSAGAPALKYGDVNTVTPSPGEVKGLIFYLPNNLFFKFI